MVNHDVNTEGPGIAGNIQEEAVLGTAAPAPTEPLEATDQAAKRRRVEKPKVSDCMLCCLFGSLQNFEVI